MFNEDIIRIAKKRIAKEKNKIDLNNPIMIVYKISNKCNLSCEYCYVKYKEIFRKVTTPKFVDFIDCMAERTNGYIYIAFHGGEPLFEINSIREIVDEVYCKKYVKRVRFSLQTNGTICDEQFFSYCREKHITIGVSIDGYNKETNKCRINNINSIIYFENIKNTLNCLRKNNIDYSVISVLTKRNSADITGLIDYLILNKIKSWSCNDMIKSNDLCSDIALTAEEKLDTYKKIIEKIISYNRYTHPFNRIYESNIRSWVRTFHRESCQVFDLCASNPCGLYNHIISIDSGGSIFPCDMVSFDEYQIGNIYSNYNKDFEQFKEKKKKLDKLCGNEMCNNCEAKRICKCNCKAVMLSEIDQKSVLCDFYIPLYNYLLSIVSDKEIVELLSPAINVHNL